MPLLGSLASGGFGKASGGAAGGGGGGPFLYAYTTYTFNTCGQGASAATKRFGPTLAQCQTTYAGTPWISSFFTVPIQGVQRLQVPSSRNYRITVAGAQGGGYGPGQANGSLQAGGGGRIIVTDVSLTQSNFIYIVCGQLGGDYTSASQCGGGGGGSFVSFGATYETSTLIVAAGGGGGGGSSGVLSSQNGQAGTTGGGWGGGTAGNGGTQGSGSEQGAPGGGWLSSGLNSASYPGAQVRSAATPRGAESVYGDSANVGGFGGGASGWGAAGGGGGYSGGGAQSAASNSGSRNSGGGGSSYTIGTLVSDNTLNYGNGYITITAL